MAYDGDAACVVILALLWAGINIGDAFWIYFYVKTAVNPVPHSAVNRTHSAWEGYSTMMYLFGFVWGWVNIGAVFFYYSVTCDDSNWTWGKNRIANAFYFFFQIIVVPIMALFLIIMPFFGGWIVTPIMQHWVYDHACDGYPMYVVLDANAPTDPAFMLTSAYFYAAGGRNPLFAFELEPDANDNTIFNFQIRKWYTHQSDIPLEMYPTLQTVQYDFSNETFTGTCILPTSPTNATGTSQDCATGLFDVGDWVPFNITSNIPLNNTFAGASVPAVSSMMHTVDKNWWYSDAAPSMIMEQIDDSNEFVRTVLRTATTKPSDCTELKVCLAGTGGYPGSVVGAEVMAPLGVLLMAQAVSGTVCSSDSSGGDSTALLSFAVFLGGGGDDEGGGGGKSKSHRRELLAFN